ncbi:MAG: type II secretion system protein [Armatimonadota bacterium]
MRRLRSTCGFTYIEFLCVMGIVLLLSCAVLSVAMPSLWRSKEAVCQRNLQQIGLALSMYAAEFGGRYPPADDDLSPLYPRYLRQTDVFRCPMVPSATRAMGSGGLAANYQYQGGLSTDADPNRGLASDDRIRHRGGVNVLFADLRVEFVSARHLAGAPMGRLDRFTWAETGLPAPPKQEWSPEEMSEAMTP